MIHLCILTFTRLPGTRPHKALQSLHSRHGVHDVHTLALLYSKLYWLIVCPGLGFASEAGFSKEEKKSVTAEMTFTHASVIVYC